MQSLISAVERVDPLSVSGRVAAVNGLLIEARGGLTRLSVGARTEIVRRADTPLPAEVVGFRDSCALLMPFGPVEGVAPGAEIRIMSDGASVRPTLAWLGRIVDAFGTPVDGTGLPTLAGDTVVITNSGGLKVHGVEVVENDLRASNGWVHPLKDILPSPESSQETSQTP